MVLSPSVGVEGLAGGRGLFSSVYYVSDGSFYLGTCDRYFVSRVYELPVVGHCVVDFVTGDQAFLSGNQKCEACIQGYMEEIGGVIVSIMEQKKTCQW